MGYNSRSAASDIYELARHLERVKKGVASHFSRELYTDECLDFPQEAIQKNGQFRAIRDFFDTLLEHQRVAIVAHDIGARVAYRLALDHEDTVERLALLDATPPTQLFGSQVPQVIWESWHIYFHQQFDLPEKLLEGREVLYLRHIFRNWSLNKFPLSDDEVAPYVQVYTHPGALRGGFGY